MPMPPSAEFVPVWRHRVFLRWRHFRSFDGGENIRFWNGAPRMSFQKIRRSFYDDGFTSCLLSGQREHIVEQKKSLRANVEVEGLSSDFAKSINCVEPINLPKPADENCACTFQRRFRRATKLVPRRCAHFRLWSTVASRTPATSVIGPYAPVITHQFSARFLVRGLEFLFRWHRLKTGPPKISSDRQRKTLRSCWEYK